MRYLKNFEEITKVVYEHPKDDHPSYKTEIKKEKRKKNGDGHTIITPPNKTKDLVMFRKSC